MLYKKPVVQPHAHVSLAADRAASRPRRLVLALILLLVLGWRFTPYAGAILITAGDCWTKIDTTPPWAPRTLYATAVFQNKLWMIGGVLLNQATSQGLTDAWSTTDGVNWTCESTTVTGGEGREGMTAVEFDGKLWLFGHSPWDDLWSSSDGRTWNRITDHLPSSNYSQVIVHDGKLWLGNVSAGEVWTSSDGVNWAQPNINWPASCRNGSCLASFNGKLWLIGTAFGGTSSGDTVWCSLDNGQTWSQTENSAGWGNNRYLASFVFRQRLWVYPLAGTAFPPEFWSTADGQNWTHLTLTGPSASPHATPQVFDGRLWQFSYEYQSQATQLWSTTLAGGPPRLKPKYDESAHEGYSYYTNEPELTQGNEPITWSLTSAPEGMTVDPNTGIINWNEPIGATEPYTITLRATNAEGQDEVSWQLTVPPAAPPKGIAPAWSAGTQCTVKWDSIPYAGGMVVQRAATPDFAQPAESREINWSRETTFTGLADGETWWYRMRGLRLDGRATPWSNLTSSTQDTVAPTCSFHVNSAVTTRTAATVTITAHDGGARPSGVAEMRFRNGNTEYGWDLWKPFNENAIADLYPHEPGIHILYAQVRDAAGNESEPTSQTIMLQPGAVFVDDDNTSGPWLGTRERPYRGIQQAIDAVCSGSQITVMPGRYKENIKIWNMDVALTSEDAHDLQVVQTTIIDGDFKGATVMFGGAETATCLLEGFTITRGRPNGEIWGYDDCYYAQNWPGGGICGNRTHATIRNNLIIGNQAYGRLITNVFPNSYIDIYGGGAGMARCDGAIQNNVIALNTAGPTPIDITYRWFEPASTTARAGFPVSHSAGILGTTTTSSYYEGGGLFECNGLIEHNTIWGNQVATHQVATYGGYAGSALSGCQGVIRDNIIWTDQPDQAAQLLDNCTTPTHCCLAGWTGGGEGNISTDPGLVDPANGDFHLMVQSNCIDAGTSIGLAVDFEGNARPIGAAPDIGAFECLATIQPLGLTAWPTVEPLRAGGTVEALWVSHVNSAGTGVRFELVEINSEGVTFDLGSDWSPTGRHQARLTLPATLATDLYCVRVHSTWNPDLFADSAPLMITAQTAVALDAWAVYE